MFDMFDMSVNICSRTHARAMSEQNICSREFIFGRVAPIGLHFEHSSVRIYEAVEQAKLLMGLALEFAALECFELCNCPTAEKSTKPPPRWGRMCHSMFEACSGHVRAVFVNGFGRCYNFIV